VRIIVLGGDGFCGWPAALHLSRHGHEVAIVDNLSRRKIEIDLEAHSLTPIAPLAERLRTWRALTGQEIPHFGFTVGENYHRLLTLLTEFRPEAVLHCAEQRSAPYSMKSSVHARYTLNNNLNATNDILAAIVESGLDVHLLHLGTMGVYGYTSAGMRIPEGYLRVRVETPEGEAEREIPYPMNPGSIYHVTKSQDQLLFHFYNRNYGLRITDLHQGIVWGTQTTETLMDQRLINRFDYDGDYGTVLNRFLVQAAVGQPLTVHGTGGQTRAFIHIRDSVRAIELAMANAPVAGERVHVVNQVTESRRIRDLAEQVARVTGATPVFVANARLEAEEHDFEVDNRRLQGFGLKPLFVSDEELRKIFEQTRDYASRCDATKLACRSYWNRERRKAVQASMH